MVDQNIKSATQTTETSII